VTCDRLDRWEASEKQWTPTLIVLRHFEALFNCEHSTSAEDADDCDNVIVKKRKIDANNKNYIAAGTHFI